MCCKAVLVVLNSLNFCLSEKLLISPSVLILAGYSNLDCRFFPFSTLNISCHSLQTCRFSVKRPAVKRMGFPLYITCCFSLAAFNILLYLAFVSLISKCTGIFLLGFILYGTLCASWDVIDYFLFHVGEVSIYNLFKNFLIPFLFSLLLLGPL